MSPTLSGLVFDGALRGRVIVVVEAVAIVGRKGMAIGGLPAFCTPPAAKRQEQEGEKQRGEEEHGWDEGGDDFMRPNSPLQVVTVPFPHVWRFFIIFLARPYNVVIKQIQKKQNIV